MRRLDQRGSSTVWGASLAVALVLVGQLCAVAIGIVARHHQVDAAADMSALSGATARQSGRAACAAARETAADNRVELLQCREEGGDVLVEVGADVGLPLGISIEVRGMARAGP